MLTLATTTKKTTKKATKAAAGTTSSKTKTSNGKPPPTKLRKATGKEIFVHGLFYGDPGSQKTRLAGTSENALLLNCDGDSGPDSIAGWSNVDIADCEDLYQLEEWAEYLRHGRHSYSMVWIDSISMLQENQMEKVLSDVTTAKPHRDRDIPDVQEYLKVQNQLKKLVRHLTGLRMHVGITAHALRVEDEDEGTVQYWPAITGKQMPQKICGYMGLVAHLKTQTDKEDENKEDLIMRTRSNDRYYAKDRYGITKSGGMKNPTIPTLIKKAQPQAKKKGE